MKSLRWEGFEFHSRCHKVKLIDLMFADDLLIFAKGTAMSIKLVANRLFRFSKVLGRKESGFYGRCSLKCSSSNP